MAPQMEACIGHKLVFEVFQRVETADAGMFLLALVDVAIAHAETLQPPLGRQQSAEIETESGLKARGVDGPEVDRLPQQTAVGIGGAVTDPVDEILVVVVKHARTAADAPPGVVFQSAFHGRKFFGLEVGVGLVTALAVIQLRDRRHTERRVVGGIDLPTASEKIARIDAGIDAHVHRRPTVLHGHDAGREGEAPEQNVVLGDKLHIGAVDTLLVIQVGAADVPRCGERFAEIGAHEVFVAQFGPEGCAPESPVEVGVEVHTEDISAVIVEGILVGPAAEEFEAVVVVVPVDGGAEVDGPFPGLCLQGRVGLEGVFELVVPLGTVECARPEVFHRETGMPAQGDGLVGVAAFIEGLATAVVGVQPAGLVARVAVAAGIAAREPAAPRAADIAAACPDRKIAEAAALDMGIQARALWCFGDNVDGSEER